MIPLDTPHWQQRGACADAPDDEVFFPAAGDSDYAEARAICGACPVVNECATYALAHPEIDHGMFGGLSPSERNNLRRRRRRAEYKAEHGVEGECPNGHDITAPHSVYKRPNGRTQCRACRRESEARSRALAAAGRTQCAKGHDLTLTGAKGTDGRCLACNRDARRRQRGKSEDEINPRIAAAAAKGAHVSMHVNRGVVSAACEHCVGAA